MRVVELRPLVDGSILALSKRDAGETMSQEDLDRMVEQRTMGGVGMDSIELAEKWGEYQQQRRPMQFMLLADDAPTFASSSPRPESGDAMVVDDAAVSASRKVKDTEYFDAYEDIGVHELMLKDTARTDAYRLALERYGDTLAGKIVLDVGSGSGILAMFAARAGAKHVYAVEASGMATLCQACVKANGLADRITVIHSRVEDVTLPTKVDIIVSEWMGFYLLHESMLPSVLVAREAWGAPGVRMIPETATVVAALVDMSDDLKSKVEFWNSVYGFDMSAIASLAQRSFSATPSIQILRPDQLLSDTQQLFHLDLHSLSPSQLASITQILTFRVARDGCVHGVALWFDACLNSNGGVVLSCHPSAPPTHWKQTVVLFGRAISVNAGQTISTRISLKSDKALERNYDISVELL